MSVKLFALDWNAKTVVICITGTYDLAIGHLLGFLSCHLQRFSFYDSDRSCRT